MASSFGSIFRISTFGESHGGAVGAIVDGCPPRLALCEADIQHQLDRRRPGQSSISTPRQESDTVAILSGISDGLTLGTPIALSVKNTDQRPDDYEAMNAAPRPSHADLSYQEKYGIRAPSGGGRASARETIARVAAGAIAEKWLAETYGIEIVAWVSAAGGIACDTVDMDTVTRAEVDREIVRCPDARAANAMETLIKTCKFEGDSVGGIVSCVCRNVPAGWGEPVFDKLHAVLGQAMLSLPAVKGFEIGSGFAGTALRGSAHNDLYEMRNGVIRAATNRSGGVQGGISNGEPIYFRTAFKPTATILKPQHTVDWQGNEIEYTGRGRHDPCVVPRAVPIVEGMAALVLIDMALRQRSYL